MQWLLSFILRYKNLFLYFFFAIITLSFSYYQSEYHKSKIFKASIFVNGVVSEPLKNLTSYFRLKKINKDLFQENLHLKSLLINENYKSDSEDKNNDFPFSLIPGYVVKNDVKIGRASCRERV